MQVSEILNDARTELLETTGSFWSDAELLRLYNRGIKDFVAKTRMLEDRATLSLQVGRKDYILPNNWTSASAIFHKQTDDSGTPNYRRLRPSNLEKMAQERPDFLRSDEESQERPRTYWIWNKTLYIDPAPKEVEDADLILFYKAKPVTVTSPTQAIEIDSDFAEGILAYILWKAWKKEQENDLADDQIIVYSSYIQQALKWRKRQSGDQRYRLDIESPYGIDSSYNTGFYPW